AYHCRALRCQHLADAFVASETRKRAVWQLWLAEYLCFCSVVVTFIPKMLANMKSVWSVIVRCDLDGKPYAIANVLNKRVSRPPITFPYLVRKDQFRVRVDTAPKPKITALVLGLYQPASVCADILPLFIQLDS